MNLENLNINIFNILIISGVIHGIIFNTIIYSQRKKLKKSTFFIGLTVLFLSLSNLQYWLIDVNLTNTFLFLKFVFIPWHWLVLPMFYFYVYSLTNRNKITSKRYLIYLFPFLIVLLIHLIQLFYKFFINNNYQIPSHFERGLFAYLEIISIIFNLVLMFICYKLVNDYENDTTYNYKWVKTETTWLKKLIYIGLIICFAWLVAILFTLINNINNISLFYPMWIGNSILVYWIGYLGLVKSKELQKRIKLREKRIESTNNKNDNFENKSKTYEILQAKIIDNKLFLNPNLSLEFLSKHLNLSEGYISQQINANAEMNYNDYINKLRVKYAKQMLLDKTFDNYTIESIGLESGFNSKSSFYAAFKKFTNQTPVQFKKDVRNL